MIPSWARLLIGLNLVVIALLAAMIGEQRSSYPRCPANDPLGIINPSDCRN